MGTLSHPLDCVTDLISTNLISTETTVQLSRRENKGQRDFHQHEDGESTQSSSVPSCSFGHLLSAGQTLVGDPLSACNITELLPPVNSAIKAEDSIPCVVSSSTQLPVSTLETNAFLVNDAAIGNNIQAPDCIPNTWNNYEFQFGKTLMDKPPLEDSCSVSNSGIGYLVQDTLTNLTSKMTLQSSTVQPSILPTISNQRDKRIVNKSGGNLEGASFVKFNNDADIVNTQGTQPYCETSIIVSFLWIDSPDAVFFRTASMQRQFEDLRYKMKKHYEQDNKRSKRNFDVGVRCAVRADRSWWRAEVVCMDNFPLCSVSFVDTGYQRSVNVKNIYPLETVFDEIKRLVLTCSLCEVYPGTRDEKWKDETIS